MRSKISLLVSTCVVIGLVWLGTFGAITTEGRADVPKVRDDAGGPPAPGAVQAAERPGLAPQPIDPPALSTQGDEARTVIHVPRAYGHMVAVSGSGADTALWFVDAAGALRNVVVGRALVRVESTD